MTPRDILRTNFLIQSGYENSTLRPIPSDASVRRYFRLVDSNSRKLILMDAPTSENFRTSEFLKIAKQLQAAGVHAPEVTQSDLKNGFVVLSDLGPNTAKAHLDEHPDDALEIYKALARVLSQTEAISVRGLSQMTSDIAGDMVSVATEFFLQRPDLSSELVQIITDAFEKYCAGASTLALRDFHLENVIWRADLIEQDRVGLIDFQDAVLAPKGYDLASLLRDARRDVDPKLSALVIDEYMAENQLDAAFRAQFHCLAIQRNLRILGIFKKLATNPEKSKYLGHLPRVKRLVIEDAEQLGFEPISTFVDRYIR